MKRIIIIINKSWEADAALSAIFNEDIRHSALDFANPKVKPENRVFKVNKNLLDFPRALDQGTVAPRAVFNTTNYQYEIWCIQNIMPKQPDGNTDPLYYSNSLLKSIAFPGIIQSSREPIALVLAFGTAGAPTEVTKNGGLVIGTNAFVFDVPHNPPVEPRYLRPEFGELLESNAPKELFQQMNLELASLQMRIYFENKALLPPTNPAGNFWLVADPSIVAVSDVNITSYADFATADPAALAAYAKLGLQPVKTAYSVETTHGLIRIESGTSKFMFISAITDRDAYFNNEVTPRASAQNFSCAFNGGMFLSWFMPFLERNKEMVG